RRALGTWGAFGGAAVELRAHGRILDLGGVDVTNPWLRHRCFLRFLLRLEDEADTLYSPCPASSFACCRMATARSTALARCLPRVFPGETAASGRVRMLAAQPRGVQVRCAAADWRGILNHRHLA